MLVGILLIAGNLRAPFTGLAPLLETVRDSLHLDNLATGALTTLPLLAFAILSPWSAPLARRYGLERTLFGALTMIAFGVLLRSAGTATLLYLGTAAIGAGIAVGNVLLPSLVKRDFPHQVASLTGAYALAMGVTAALGSVVMIPLARWWGWQAALLIFLLLPLAALIALTPGMAQVRKALRGAPRGAPATPVPDMTAASPYAPVWRSAMAWQITLFLGLNSTIYYVVVGWLPAILVDSGMSQTQAGTYHGLLQLATTLPGLLLAPLLRRLPDQRLPAVGVCLSSAVAVLGLMAAPQWAVIWSVLFGIGTGGGIILGLTLIGLRTHHAHQAAALSGMSQSLGYLLAAAGPMAIGALHDVIGGWTLPLALTAILSLMAAIAGYLAGRDLPLGCPITSSDESPRF